MTTLVRTSWRARYGSTGKITVIPGGYHCERQKCSLKYVVQCKHNDLKENGRFNSKGITHKHWKMCL